MQAMIFSAGLGTRFKPWTDKHPKALAMVNGKSLLQRNIEYLQQYGIKDIIVNVHHFAEQIEDAIVENDGWGSNILISDERDVVLETGGGLLKAKELFNPGERFITCNVDILSNLNINKLLTFHEQHHCGWRNSLTGEEKGPHLTSPQRGGTTSLIEKAYSCFVVFEYDIFRLMEENNFTGKFSLIDVYLKLAADHLIMGYDHSGDKLVDVGKPESVAVAESLFV